MKPRRLTFYSKQARQPTGIFGRFIMSGIFRKRNQPLNDFVFETLAVDGSENILEIGSGPGVLAHQIAGRLTTGVIQGVDFSQAMIKCAIKNNRKHIDEGKASFHFGDFQQIPFESNSFDIIFSVNTIYFWTNPKAMLLKIADHLKPGGIMALGFHDRNEMEKMPLNTEIFTYYSIEDLEALISANGLFEKIHTISKKVGESTCRCAVAVKKSEG